MAIHQIKQDRFLNSLGWGGGIICLIAYGLNTQEMLASTSLSFLLMNVVRLLLPDLLYLSKRSIRQYVFKRRLSVHDFAGADQTNLITQI